ncbi:MAG: class I SAM-dependent methyltransferase [Myxococcota bacterium]
MAAPAETPLQPSKLAESPSPSSPPVALPEVSDRAGQGPEYCLVDDGGAWQPVRLREDCLLWEWPGAYEYLVRELLEGDAARTICGMLGETMRAAGDHINRLRVLNLGAGNGWVGGELAEVGAEWILGVDRSPTAAAATERDNPGIYADYLVMDMRRLSETQRDRLMHYDFNCLACVDPLAADEPAPNAFTEAFNLLAPEGWVAFHVREDALHGESDSRFAPLVQQMAENGAISLHDRQRYRHRLTTRGTPLVHVAFIGRKQRDFDPAER